jgi:hypothetical protein
MTRASMAWGSVLAATAWLAAPIAEAQRRVRGEPTDFTGLGVVLGLLVLGIGAYFLARGKR